jgi:hypothetical protein
VFPQNPGYIDVKPAKRNGAFEETSRLSDYEMELSRGASHIASMLYEQSMLAAVGETIQEFEASRGRNELQAFAHALRRRLEQRAKPAAAWVLQHFMECGRLPDAVPGAPPGPVSAPPPVVRKLKSTTSRKANAREAA